MDDIAENQQLEASLHRLIAGFPDVPPDVVSSLLGDSYITVVRAAGRPLVDEAERLATLRLEVRTRHPSTLSALAGDAVPSKDEDRAAIRAMARRVTADARSTRERAAAERANSQGVTAAMRQLLTMLRTARDETSDSP